MSIEFLKALLDHSFYDKHKSVITPDFVPKDYQDLYHTIIKNHVTAGVSLSVDDLKALHKSNHPVMSASKELALEPLYKNLQEAEVLNPIVQNTIIDNKIAQRIADEIAVTAIEIASGKDNYISDLQTLVDRLNKVKNKTHTQEGADQRKINIINLVRTKKHDLKWKFNLPDLQDRLGGTGSGYFGVVAARPDGGKTSFMMSLSCAPNGFIHQGAKVHYIGNEESIDRLKFRALSALTGLPEKEIIPKAEQLQLEYASVLDNLFVHDGFGLTIETLDSYCSNNEVDILIIDQLDKLGVTGKYGTTEEKLRGIYAKTRDIGKKHNCAVVGICQAGFTAHNRLHYGFECLDGSKTGKGAECDWCITIGMETHGNTDNYYRIANIPKNKVTGKKAFVTFVLNPEISRIHA